MDWKKDLNWVLKKTGFLRFYPEKLTRETFFQLTDPSKFRKDGTGSYSLKDLCEIFMNKIKLCHSDARNLPSGKPVRYGSYSSRGTRSPLRQTDAIHPLDVITMVYLCCDPIARQDLTRLLWECKFAIPFLINPHPEKHPIIFAWPLKALKYRPVTPDSWDKSITDYTFSVISFLRLGNTRISKSGILNIVACQSTQEYPVFFHRDSQASTRQRSSLTDGLVEVTFSSIQEIDTMFMNLRGDGLLHRNQVENLIKMSSVLVVLLEQENFDKTRQMLMGITKDLTEKNILLLITDMDANDPSDIGEADIVLRKFQESFTIDIIPIDKMPKPELLDEINRFIDLVPKDPNRIDSLIGNLSQVLIDENNPGFIESAKEVEKLLQIIDDQEIEKLFPCQGERFRQLALANKGLYRETDQNKVQTHKQSLKLNRSQQLTISKEHDTFIFKFLETFHHIEGDDTKRQIFLRMLSQALENKYQRMIHKCQQEHRRIMYFKSPRNVDETDTSISHDLLTLEEKMSRASITLSVFVREIGQMYEALRDSGAPIEEYDYLPDIAVTMLRDGYPLEIMDGKTTSVPIAWTNAVLERLNTSLQKINGKKDIRVRVISILGIQSSGKSTLLNAMFGPTFPVGSGRCTRGVYLHVVRLAPDRAEIEGIDYFLVVDGEGISALEYEENLSRERELATFVLGLADYTIINIMSENTIYLRDILPISVHAFLRMDLVGIETNCSIVHQNVDPMSQQFMIQHWDDLKRTLDEYTKAACNLEHVPVTRFQDIVKLDITNDIHCIPSFQRHYDRVEVVNSGYSDRVSELVASICSKPTRGRCLDEFQKFLNLLWTALKKENFVHEFKSTVEAEARLIADDNWCRCAWQLRIESRKLLTNLQHNIRKSQSTDACTSCFAISVDIFKKLFQQCFDTQHEDMRAKFGKVSGIFREQVKKLRKPSFDRLSSLHNAISSYAQKELKSTNDLTMKEFRLKLEDRKVVKEVRAYIKSEWHTMQTDRTERHEEIFQKWLQSVKSMHEIFYHHRDQMMVMAEKTLHEAFPSYVTHISDKLQNLQEFDLLKFSPIEKHFSNVSRKANVDMNMDRANKLVLDIRNDVIEYFNERNRNKIPFDGEVFTELLARVKYCEEIEKGYLGTRKTFQIDLAICITAYALNTFQRGNAETDDKVAIEVSRKRFNDILYSVLADEKQRLEDFLLNVKDRVIDEVIKRVCASVVDNISAYKIKDVKVFSSKRIVLLFLLMDIIQEGDHKQVYSYVHYEKGCIRAWVCKVFEQYWSQLTTLKSASLLMKLLNEVLQDVNEVLRDCCSSSAESEVWKQNFYTRLGKEINVVGLNLLLEDINVSYLKAELLDGLKRIGEDMRGNACEQFFGDRYYEDLRIAVTEMLVKNILGCSSMCPCCGEICIYGQRDHEGKHKCLVHRPGLLRSGYNIDGDKTQIFLRYPDWDQCSIIENESALQYISMVYHCSSRRQSGVSLSPTADIPEEWKALTAKEEVQKLLTLCKDQ